MEKNVSKKRKRCVGNKQQQGRSRSSLSITLNVNGVNYPEADICRIDFKWLWSKYMLSARGSLCLHYIWHSENRIKTRWKIDTCPKIIIIKEQNKHIVYWGRI